MSDGVIRYMTQAQVARAMNAPVQTISQAYRRGVLIPDAYAANTAIFRPDNESVKAYALTMRPRARKRAIS